MFTVGKCGKVGAGRPSVLTPAEEKAIVVTCQVLQELGYGLTRQIVTDVVYHFLKDQGRPSPFKDGSPDPDWWQAFMGRWPSLVERIPQHLSAKRASAASPDTLKSWFELLRGFLQKVKLMDCNITTVSDYASRVFGTPMKQDFVWGL